MWNYAALTKTAKQAGGPEKFTQALIKAGEIKMLKKFGKVSLVIGGVAGAYIGVKSLLNERKHAETVDEYILNQPIDENIQLIDCENKECLELEVLDCDDESSKYKVSINDDCHYVVSEIDETAIITFFNDEEEGESFEWPLSKDATADLNNILEVICDDVKLRGLGEFCYNIEQTSDDNEEENN
jgi:hypothetical protein